MVVPDHPPTHELQYAGVQPKPASGGFRIGRVGLLLSAFNVTAFGMLQVICIRFRVNWQVHSDISMAVGAVSVISLGMGIAGCFQCGAGFVPAWVIVISLLILILLPVFAY
jgi:hypothetical protein